MSISGGLNCKKHGGYQRECKECVIDELNKKIAKLQEALKNIGEDTPENTRFNTGEEEAQYYIDVAKEALK